MQLKPEEISKVIRSQIKYYENAIRQDETGTVLMVGLKLSVLESAVKGKNIVLVDDSIVRGTTIANLIHLLKHAGAKEVHVRVSSPPFLYPCYFGTDVPSNQLLIASSHSTEEIRQLIGADSLGYMKIEDLQSMVGDLPLCRACFDNHYPMDIPNQ